MCLMWEIFVGFRYIKELWCLKDFIVTFATKMNPKEILDSENSLSSINSIL